MAAQCSKWSPDAILMLRQLWSHGVSANEIAKRMARSKNSIIGKVHYLKLPKRELPTLADLGPDQCRWPFGDPKKEDFHFCAERVSPGKPYCPSHCKRAYRPIANPPVPT